MEPNRYTQVSNAAGERYQTVLNTFRGMLHAALGEPFSGAAAERLRSDAAEVARMYLRSETPIIEDVITETAQRSLETAQRDLGVQVASGIPDVWSAFLDANIEFLTSEVRSQLSRDIEMLVRRYREFGLETQMRRFSTDLAPDRTRFYYRDRVGRLYPSTKFIRTVWRHTNVTTAAELYVLEVASAGINEVEVTHPDPNSRWSGMIIGLNDSSKAPAFIDVRDEVFHPQTEVSLKPHVPS